MDYNLNELLEKSVDTLYDEYLRSELEIIASEVDVDEPEHYPNKDELIMAIKDRTEDILDVEEPEPNFEYIQRESGLFKVYDDGEEERLEMTESDSDYELKQSESGLYREYEDGTREYIE